VATPVSRSSGSIPRNRRRKAAITIAVAAATVAVFQLGFGLASECSLYIRDPGYSDKEIRLTRQEALDPGQPLVLMLGTSRTAAAFHAGRVREQLGDQAVVFNFGIPASGPITHILYLKRLLADGHHPDLLILEVLPPTLGTVPLTPHSRGPLEGRFFFGDRLQHHETGSVIGYGFPAEAVRSKWRQSIAVPWYALRFPIMGRVMPSAQPWQLRFDWSRGCDDFGWGASITESVSPEQYEAGLQRARNEYAGILLDLEPNGGGARALADLLEMCGAEKIAVRLVLMPEASGFRDIYPPLVLERVRGFLSGLCTKYGCELADAREWLPDACFQDGHHMLRSGAEIFSDRLNREVIEPFSRTHWLSPAGSGMPR
jgi:hypothetical protein